MTVFNKSIKHILTHLLPAHQQLATPPAQPYFEGHTGV
jgi:hypothetical protein